MMVHAARCFLPRYSKNPHPALDLHAISGKTELRSKKRDNYLCY